MQRKRPATFVPPGGYAGFAQQTPAVQSLLSRPAKRRAGSAPVRRKKRATKKVARKRVRTRAKPATRARSAKKPARLVKGSAAAKRHMAKLRKMRRR